MLFDMQNRNVHCMWIDGTEFIWSNKEAAALTWRRHRADGANESLDAKRFYFTVLDERDRLATLIRWDTSVYSCAAARSETLI